MAENKTGIKNNKCYVSGYIFEKIEFENLLSIYFLQNEETLNEKLFFLRSKFSIYVNTIALTFSFYHKFHQLPGTDLVTF